MTFDLHSKSRDPRWPPNTFFKVKFGPKTTHNSANFWSNSIIFVLFCCCRPVLYFGWKSSTNNSSMCLLAPEKRPSYTTLHYYGKLHCRHFQLRMMGKLIQTVTVPPLISLQWHINAFRKVLLRAAHSVIVKKAYFLRASLIRPTPKPMVFYGVIHTPYDWKGLRCKNFGKGESWPSLFLDVVNLYLMKFRHRWILNERTFYSFIILFIWKWILT